MKVRCHSCYSVLNNNEEYCTRCGEHSSEVEKILKTGILPFNETSNLKNHVIIFLLLGCVLNGVLYVAFGQLFMSMNRGINLGEVGELLPAEIRYFSVGNALIISSIILSAMAIIINISQLKKIFGWDKKFLRSNIIYGTAVVISFVVLTYYTPLKIIPDYIDVFLRDPSNKIFSDYVGSVNYFKVIVILLGFGFIEEMYFRTAVMRYFDEATTWSPMIVVMVQAFVSALLTFGALSVFNRFGNFSDALLTFIGSYLLHVIMGISYYMNQRKLTFNVILRTTIAIAIIIFFTIGGIIWD